MSFIEAYLYTIKFDNCRHRVWWLRLDIHSDQDRGHFHHPKMFLHVPWRLTTSQQWWPCQPTKEEHPYTTSLYLCFFWIFLKMESHSLQSFESGCFNSAGHSLDTRDVAWLAHFFVLVGFIPLDARAGPSFWWLWIKPIHTFAYKFGVE